VSDLPPGWEWATLGELVDVLDYLRVPVSADERLKRRGRIPYYGASGQVGWIDKKIFDEELVLLGEDGVQFFDRSKIKAYKISGPAWVNNHAHVLRSRSQIDHCYLLHYLNSFDYRGYATGTTRLKLTQAAMNKIPVPLAPADEQRRIATAFEEYLSRLDAGLSGVRIAKGRLNSLRKRVIIDAVDGSDRRGWTVVSVAEAGVVDLGRQRHPDWHVGPNMRPYLRVANVFEDEIRLNDVKEMSFPPDVFARFALCPGDILLNEGQSPEYLGRPAMYRGEPGRLAFTNSLLRFRAMPGILPEWALLVFRRHLHAGRFVKEVRITTNIAHLSATRFKSIEFPVPPMEVQTAIVKRTQGHLDMISRMAPEVEVAERRGERLRQAVLADAFAGRLLPQHHTDEPASVLLEYIRAERATAPKPKRAWRGPQPDPAQEALS